jgi:quinol monooxygenase YgiN
MTVQHILFLGGSALAATLAGRAAPGNGPSPYVRVAEIEIDPTQIENYHAAAREEIETSVLVEPGVLGLYAVAEKDHPTRIRVLEIYADVAAYQAHLETPHFKKYKAVTQPMVKSLKLFDAVPVALHAKEK